jgi:hypothetical protein
MSLAQKFRGFVASKPAIALTSLLTLSSLLPFSNATAQEPRITPVSSTAPTDIQQQIRQSRQNTENMIKEGRRIIDETKRMVSGEIVDGKESEHTIIAQAQSHSIKNKQIAFFVYKGQADEGLTGKQVVEKLTTHFSRKNITDIKPYLEAGGQNTVIGFYVQGHLIGPFPLDKTAVQGANIAADLFQHPEKLPKDTVLLGFAPQLNQE